MWNGRHPGGLHGAGVHVTHPRGCHSANQDGYKPGDNCSTVSGAISHTSGWGHFGFTFLVNFDQCALDFNHGAAFDGGLRTLDVGLGLALHIHFGAFQGGSGSLQVEL
jgi:hypothetical protein